MYNPGSGKIPYRMACQLSTKNEVGEPNTPPIENERGAIHFETASRVEKRLAAHIYLPMPLLISTIAIVELATMLQTYQLDIIC